jgi:aminoglycoside 3-N-acetyltransferase
MASRDLSRTPITRGEIAEQLHTLGVQEGGVLMAHCRLSSLGWVIGGADAVVLALLDVLGPEGTLAAMTGWEHDSYLIQEWPEAVREAYLSDPPIFDPLVSEADREVGRLPERIRTWPGALRSDHPLASLAAVGARAEWLTSDHPLHHPFGVGSPFARLVEAEADVLMLGAPPDTLTILHHAEELAEARGKKRVKYPMARRIGDRIEWVDIEDIETSIGAFPYERVVPDDIDAFEVIARDALRAGVGRTGSIGESESHLFPAPDLVEFAVEWLERRFK